MYASLFVAILVQEQSYAQPLLEFALEMVEKYNGKCGSAVNFGSGTGISSFLLSKNFEKVPIFDHIQY